MTRLTRRSTLQLAGASLVAATVPAAASASEDGWTTVETPIDSTLHDVAYAATNAHAVAEGGTVLERTDAGWEIVLQGGPTGNGNDLYGVDTTDGVSASDASGASSDEGTESDGAQWVPESLGDADLFDVETDGDEGYTVGSGGVIFEPDGGEWSLNQTPVGETLQAVADGPVAIAVGSGGTVLERSNSH